MTTLQSESKNKPIKIMKNESRGESGNRAGVRPQAPSSVRSDRKKPDQAAIREKAAATPNVQHVLSQSQGVGGLSQSEKRVLAGMNHDQLRQLLGIDPGKQANSGGWTRVQHRKAPRGKCFHCGGFGHYKVDCPDRPVEDDYAAYREGIKEAFAPKADPAVEVIKPEPKEDDDGFVDPGIDEFEARLRELRDGAPSSSEVDVAAVIRDASPAVLEEMVDIEDGKPVIAGHHVRVNNKWYAVSDGSLKSYNTFRAASVSAPKVVTRLMEWPARTAAAPASGVCGADDESPFLDALEPDEVAAVVDAREVVIINENPEYSLGGVDNQQMRVMIHDVHDVEVTSVMASVGRRLVLLQAALGFLGAYGLLAAVPKVARHSKKVLPVLANVMKDTKFDLGINLFGINPKLSTKVDLATVAADWAGDYGGAPEHPDVSSGVKSYEPSPGWEFVDQPKRSVDWMWWAKCGLLAASALSTAAVVAGVIFDKLMPNYVKYEHLFDERCNLTADMRPTSQRGRDIWFKDALVSNYLVTDGYLWNRSQRREKVSMELFTSCNDARNTTFVDEPERLRQAINLRAGVEDRINQNRYHISTDLIANNTARMAYHYVMGRRRHAAPVF